MPVFEVPVPVLEKVVMVEEVTFPIMVDEVSAHVMVDEMPAEAKGWRSGRSP